MIPTTLDATPGNMELNDETTDDRDLKAVVVVEVLYSSPDELQDLLTTVGDAVYDQEEVGMRTILSGRVVEQTADDVERLNSPVQDQE